ncbi:MAG TPA: galactokinase [Jiangellaceae bacterium]|nr:galactokinase [Jiangellaceae bacterium]
MSPPAALVEAFRDAYGREPAGLWAAPGRVNLIGEHTDYNDGFVLPLALAQRVVVAAALSPSRTTRMRSLQSPGEDVTVDAAAVTPGGVTGWSAYVAGVAWALRVDGHPVRDIDVVVDGDVPLGAGLSSSAALECAAAIAWSDLSGLSLDRTAVARLCQRAENGFVGAPTGVMDQMASMHGRENHAVFLDTRSMAVEHVSIDLSAHGLALLVVDTRAPHRHVDGEYVARRRDCEEAARLLGVPALRDAALTDLGALPLPLLPRARHVVTENARVLAVADLLRSGADLREIGPALTASHLSLRDDFEITVPEVDLAVDTLLEAGAYGARITGGGFGGCVIALVEDTAVEASVRAVESAFAGRRFDPPSSFVAVPSAGAHRLAPDARPDVSSSTNPPSDH